MKFPDRPVPAKRARGVKAQAYGISSETFFEQYDLVSDALHPVLTIRFYRGNKLNSPVRCKVIWRAFDDTFTFIGKGKHRTDALYDTLYRLGVTDTPPDLTVDALLQMAARSLSDKIIYLNHAEA